MATRDYTSVTESPGVAVSREAIAMVGTRYAFASTFCRGRRVLELACGPGVGLRYLRDVATMVVGGDYTLGLLQQHRQSDDTSAVLQLDAHRLPFDARSFDVVIIFEALYFMADASAVMDECLRVLAPGGTLILANANPERPGFNPAPWSTRYFTAAELEASLTARGCTVESFGAFPLEADGPLAPLVALVRKIAVSLGLVPKTMRGKALLKRLLYGTIVRFPAQVGPEHVTAGPPVRLTDAVRAERFKVIYAVATTPGENVAL